MVDRDAPYRLENGAPSEDTTSMTAGIATVKPS